MKVCQLCRTTVVIADITDQVGDLLAVHAHDHAQRTMSARVLRSEIYIQRIRILLHLRHAPLLRPKSQLLIEAFRFFLGHLEHPHLRGSRWVFLAQGMALPPWRHEDTPEIGVAVHTDAVHVPQLPLVPVRRRPDAGDRRQLRVIVLQGDLQPYILRSIEGEQLVHRREPACRLPGPMHPLPLVDRGEVVEHEVRPVYFVFQKLKRLPQLPDGNPASRNAVAGLLGDHRLRSEVLPKCNGSLSLTIRHLVHPSPSALA
jgi:hypothetical protein